MDPSFHVLTSRSSYIAWKSWEKNNETQNAQAPTSEEHVNEAETSLVPSESPKIEPI